MNKIIIGLVVALMLLPACTKEFIERDPITQIAPEAVLKTDQDLVYWARGLYSVMQGLFAYGEGWPKIADLPSDDVTYKQTSDLEEFQWTPVSSKPNSGFWFTKTWGTFYEGVYRCNYLLSKLSEVPNASAEAKKMAEAEARFCRALFYWHLTATFGPIPKVDHLIKITEPYPAASTEDEIYRFMEEDLKMAEAILPNSWSGTDVGRATKWAAKALLGKIYLYHASIDADGRKGWWTASAEKLEEVLAVSSLDPTIAGLQFGLLPNFRAVFGNDLNENNKESIFEIQYADNYKESITENNGYFTDGFNAGEGSKRDLTYGILHGNASWGGYVTSFTYGYSELIATRDIWAEFEKGDPRMRESIYYIETDTSLKAYSIAGTTTIAGTGYYDTLWSYKSFDVGKILLYLPPLAKAILETGSNEIGQYFHVRKEVNGFASRDPAPGNSSTNFRVIRLADVMLMAAEAYNETGNLTRATDLLNALRKARRQGRSTYWEVRRSAGTAASYDILPDFPYTTQTNAENSISYMPTLTLGNSKGGMRSAIIHERRVELAFECIRFLDTRRWERFSADHPGATGVVFSKKFIAEDKKAYDPSKHVRGPIPQIEQDLSGGNLKQNPGY